MDLERLGAVGGLLLTNLILLHWMTTRLTRDISRQQQAYTAAIHLLTLETAGLRNDLTMLLVNKSEPTATEIRDRVTEIRNTIAMVQQQLGR